MALPLKSGADLYNHELLRARLQNLGAQPNTADVGLGQVYFNTGSGTAASLRIGYCYETGSVPQFHHLANLEDISRLEELIDDLGEVSGGNISEVLTKVNALDEKVTAFLDGTADSDAVLENLKEIQEFLDNYDAEVSLSEQLNDLSDAIDDVANRATKVSVSQTLASGKEIGSITVDGTATKLYAPATYAWGEITSKPTTLAGYGITDAVLKQDYINLNDLATQKAQVMGYCNPEGGWKTYSSGILSKTHDNGFALQGAANVLFFRGVTGSVWEDNWHEVLHTGNFNNYAPTLTGTGASGTWGIDISGKAAGLINHGIVGLDNFNYNGLTTYDGNTEIGRYGVVFQFANTKTPIAGNNGHWLFQLAASTAGSLYFRRRINNEEAWQPWKQLAFTDSNVASATKLATPRSLWGNSFDGTADINGDIRLPNYKALQSYTVDGTLRNLVVFNTADNLDLGDANYGTSLIGNNLVFKTGSWKNAMLINSSGNVTVGSLDLASEDYKLYVDGGTYINVHNTTAHTTLGTLPKNVLALGQKVFGLAIWTQYGGASCLQSGRFDGTETAYTLSLNPLGGYVGIGTIGPSYRLDVNGTFRASGVANLSSRVLVGTPPDDETVMLNVNGTIRARSTEMGSMLYTHITNTGVTIVRDRDLFTGAYTGGLDCDAGYIASVYSNPDDDEYWYFYGGRSLTTAAITVRDNFVGIGTPAPSEKLHVVGNLYVTGNIIADGEVSAGGVAEEGTGGGTIVGGSRLERVTFTIPSGSTTFDCAHNLDTREITVAIYEEGNDYQQVLADVYLDDVNTARIVFGSATDVAHKVVIIG